MQALKFPEKFSIDDAPAEEKGVSTPLSLLHAQAVRKLIDVVGKQGVTLTIEAHDNPIKALEKAADEFVTFCRRQNMPEAMVEQVLEDFAAKCEDFIDEKKPTPLTVKLMVTNKPYESDSESKTTTVFMFDGFNEYGSGAARIVNTVGYPRNKMTEIKEPDYNQVFQSAEKKVLLFVFEKDVTAGLNGIDNIAAAVADAAGPGATAEDIAKIIDAIENGEASLEVSEIVRALSDIALLTAQAQAPDVPAAVQDRIQAEIATLKETLADLIQSPELIGIVPPVLVQAAQQMVQTPVIAAVTAEVLNAPDGDVPVAVAGNDNDTLPEQIEAALSQIQTLLQSGDLTPEVQEILQAKIDVIQESLATDDKAALADGVTDIKTTLTAMAVADNVPPQIAAQLSTLLPTITTIEIQALAASAPKAFELPANRADVVIEKLQETLAGMDKNAPDAKVIAEIAENLKDGKPISADQQAALSKIVTTMDVTRAQPLMEAVAVVQAEAKMAATPNLEPAKTGIPVGEVVLTMKDSEKSVTIDMIKQADIPEPLRDKMIELVQQGTMRVEDFKVITAHLDPAAVTPGAQTLIKTIDANTVQFTRDVQAAIPPVVLSTPVAQLMAEKLKDMPDIAPRDVQKIIDSLKGAPIPPETMARILPILAKTEPRLEQAIVRNNINTAVTTQSSKVSQALQQIKDQPGVEDALRKIQQGRPLSADNIQKLHANPHVPPEVKRNIAVLAVLQQKKLEAQESIRPIRRELEGVSKVLQQSGGAAAKVWDDFRRKNPEATVTEFREFYKKLPEGTVKKEIELAVQKHERAMPSEIVPKNPDVNESYKAFDVIIKSPDITPVQIATLEEIRMKIVFGEPIDNKMVNELFKDLPPQAQDSLREQLNHSKAESILAGACEGCPNKGSCPGGGNCKVLFKIKGNNDNQPEKVAVTPPSFSTFNMS